MCMARQKHREYALLINKSYIEPSQVQSDADMLLSAQQSQRWKGCQRHFSLNRLSVVGKKSWTMRADKEQDSSDIFISSNTLSHWEPWQSPICSLTDYCQRRDSEASLSNSVSLLHGSAVWHKGASKVPYCVFSVLAEITIEQMSINPACVHLAIQGSRSP